MDMTTSQVLVNACIDVGSVYSWFGLQVLLRYKHRWGLKVNVRPVLLGAVLQATENSMPSSVPARGRWLTQDIARNTKFMNVPFKGLPANFGTPSFNTILCQRVLTAVTLSKGYDSQEVVDLFFSIIKAIWGVKEGNEIDIMDPAFVMKCCEAAGISEDAAREYLQQSNDATVKQALKENSVIAVDKGAFGTPTLFVYLKGDDGLDSEIWKHGTPDVQIFGSDRFEQLAFVLGKKWDGPNPIWSRI